MPDLWLSDLPKSLIRSSRSTMSATMKMASAPLLILTEYWIKTEGRVPRRKTSASISMLITIRWMAPARHLARVTYYPQLAICRSIKCKQSHFTRLRTQTTLMIIIQASIELSSKCLSVWTIRSAREWGKLVRISLRFHQAMWKHLCFNPLFSLATTNFPARRLFSPSLDLLFLRTIKRQPKHWRNCV